MRINQARKLTNGDEVQVRNTLGSWERGFVLGSVDVKIGIRGPSVVMIPVQTTTDGFRTVSHLDVK